MATHSSSPAWILPWTEEPGGLQSMGLQRVGRSRETKQPGWEPASLALRPALGTAPKLFLQHQPRDLPHPTAACPHQGSQVERPSCGRASCQWDLSLPIPRTTLNAIARVFKQLQKFLAKEM